MRATFITRALDNGASLEEVQKAAGHADASTTKRYDHRGYDPEKSALWSYRVLFGQWRRLYELGAWRRAQGVEAWTPGMLIRSIREFYRDRPGSALAD